MVLLGRFRDARPTKMQSFVVVLSVSDVSPNLTLYRDRVNWEFIQILTARTQPFDYQR